MTNIFKLSFRRLIASVLAVVLFQFLLVVILAGTLRLNEISRTIDSRLAFILEDITFENDRWNLSKYNSDGRLIGFYPLYIIDHRGFILDRRLNISGFLDTSDFADLLKFTVPTTITTTTGNNRRIFSRAVNDSNGETVGVVTVSYANADDQALGTIDNTLSDNLELLLSRITVVDSRIDVSAVDAKQIPFRVTYTVVDRFNTVLAKNANTNNLGRTPTSIDPSYFKQVVQNPPLFVRDQDTGEYYFLRSRVFNQDGSDLAVAIVGGSLKNLFTYLSRLSFWLFLSSLPLSLILCLVFINFQTESPKIVPKIISFDPVKSILSIDDNLVKIPYATNQYYLVKTILSDPHRRWETDEIFEKFGDINLKKEWRKIYDTMVMINKKTFSYLRDKLILNEDKTYHLNPKFLNR